jgi:hypothetical protein
MDTENADQQKREEGCSEVRVMSASEALRIEPRHIEVPENAELLLSPANSDYASSFARVRIKSYEDLKTLGLVPRKLAEEKVHKAIAADDREVYDFASKMPSRASGDCGCSGGTEHAGAARENPVRGSYNSIRSRHNPALSRILADHYGSDVAWDAPAAAIVRTWVVAARLKPEIIIALFGDITIQKNGTLAVAANSKSLMAWNIWIHQTGKLVGQGSYLKIWANSINRFSGFLNLSAVESARKITPLWTLAD